MANALTLKEWAEAWAGESQDRVIAREKAGASPQVVWFRRGEQAAYEHLLALLRKHPELDSVLTSENG